MAATLLPLPDDGVSLELEPSDLLRLVGLIERHFGTLTIEPYPTYANYRFGGFSFVFQNDWDDPCLIAGSDGGSQILRQLHGHLVGDS